MRITNGNIFNGKRFVLGDAYIQEDHFVEYTEAGFDDIDAQGAYVIPGLIDVHFHGAVGKDFCDADDEGIGDIARFEASQGITTIVPTTMTLPTERLLDILSTIATHETADGEAFIGGINLEGPFISPDKVGAQNPAYVRGATLEEFDCLQDAAKGLIKLIDVAPEQPGNLAFIHQVADQVRVSVAHTSAIYEEAHAAFEAGARHLTHLYNAMPTLHHRSPGPIAAAAERVDVTPEIIADGVHVAPAMVRLAFNMFGPERMILISDSLRACGLGDGEYELGGQLFKVVGNRATIENGSLAGSVSNLMSCVRAAATQMDIPLEHAVAAATKNPARALGLNNRGAIKPGCVADAVILDEDLQIQEVVLRGKPLL